MNKMLKGMNIKLFVDRGYLKSHVNLWTTENAKGLIKPIRCPECDYALHYNETFNEIFCVNCKFKRELI